MACKLNSDSRRLYSWWWDSHISPKSSKWLQENLKDMDAKVKSMIKLIEEDADSFARRAEMYYKKRPELMKLVEEFYRAYRALAERYDYATGELRYAQRTLAAAFPNQVPPIDLIEGTESNPDRALFDPGDPQKNGSFSDLDASKEEGWIVRAGKAECEIRNLKKALADMLAEKESLLVKYEQSLENVSKADGELNRALEESKKLEEKASKAEEEVCMLKDTLGLLRAEKDAGLSKQSEYLETILGLEEKIARAQEESENEARWLSEKLSRLESEHDSGLDRIWVLEKKIEVAEKEAETFSEQAAKARLEIENLKRDLADSNEEKEALRVLYAECLEKSCKLELDLASAQEEVQRLKSEVVIGTKKLRNSEEICARLENSNQSLKLEANDLTNKIMSKDRELREKHNELEKLQICAKNEHTHYVQVEAALETLRALYTRSQEEQRALSIKLKNGLKMLDNLESSKSGLEHENTSLNERNAASEVEIVGLRQMKERLEEEVALQMGQSSAMQREISGLKEEITALDSSYRALMGQLERAGLDPETIGPSVNGLRDENTMLKRAREKDRDSTEGLTQKIENIKQLLENNTALESSLFDVNCDLEAARNRAEELRNSCELLRGEKSTLVLEKSLLLSQLHLITVNMQKLMDQSGALENSLSSANIELERLREKSTGLEELCRVLNNEKSNLVSERNSLADQLESVHRRLETLENRFAQFEERYGGLEKEQKAGNDQVRELMRSLSSEKQERESFMITNETRLADLENRIHRKDEFQEELDKAVIAQFENFILHKFIEEIEEKNYSLMVDREKHIEASKLADKLISELETEVLEQQVEEELLLVEVENLRLGIYQAFLALEIGSNGGLKDGFSIEDIISNIKDLKRSISKTEDDKHRMSVENNIVVTLLRQLEFEVRESELHKTELINEYENMKDDFLRAKKENLELRELQLSFLGLQERYTRAVEENRGLSEDFLSLKEENRMIKEENDGIVLESLTISTTFRSLSAEKAMELNRVRRFNEDLENELIMLREKLDLTRSENSRMQLTIERLELELEKAKNANSEMGFVIEKMARKCEESEVKIEALEKETVKLSSDRSDLKTEIEHLREANGILHGDLEERKNEFELWDAEAASFFFDLQVSNTRDILFESKVHELAEVCEGLEGESVSKDMEIEVMKEKAEVMEREMKGLRAELLAYNPVIGSLKGNMASLERSFFSMTSLIKSKIVHDVEPSVHHPDRHMANPDPIEIPKSLELNRISDLLEFQTRISTLEKVIVEDINRLSRTESPETDAKPKSRGKRYLTIDNLNLTKTKPETSDTRKGVPIRDIPLDQASDGSSSSRRSQSRRGYSRTDDSMIDQAHEPKRLPYEPQIEELDIMVSNPATKNVTFVQKLKSDAQTLANLESTVKDLAKRLKSARKSKKSSGVDFETVKEQIEEAEETISQLVNVNVESKSTIEKNPGLSAWVEQDDSWKGSEKIKRVQLEVQKIQYVVLKLQEEKKGKGKSRTSVILRDFIRRGSAGRRRRRLCGCFTPSPSRVKV